jgi:hypothetical protein
MSKFDRQDEQVWKEWVSMTPKSDNETKIFEVVQLKRRNLMKLLKLKQDDDQKMRKINSVFTILQLSMSVISMVLSAIIFYDTHMFLEIGNVFHMCMAAKGDIWPAYFLFNESNKSVEKWNKIENTSSRKDTY